MLAYKKRIDERAAESVANHSLARSAFGLKGDVHTAIRASMSIPGVFCPVECDGKVLVDGGLVNPLPIEVCRQLGADKVIAVDLNCRGLDTDPHLHLSENVVQYRHNSTH